MMNLPSSIDGGGVGVTKVDEGGREYSVTRMSRAGGCDVQHQGGWDMRHRIGVLE